MASKKKLKVQALVFDRKVFNNKRQIKEWITKNDYKLKKNTHDPVKKYDKQYRVRQRRPNVFVKSSLKEYWLEKGVKAIKGKLR